MEQSQIDTNPPHPLAEIFHHHAPGWAEKVLAARDQVSAHDMVRRIMTTRVPVDGDAFRDWAKSFCLGCIDWTFPALWKVLGANSFVEDFLERLSFSHRADNNVQECIRNGNAYHSPEKVKETHTGGIEEYLIWRGFLQKDGSFGRGTKKVIRRLFARVGLEARAREHISRAPEIKQMSEAIIDLNKAEYIARICDKTLPPQERDQLFQLLVLHELYIQQGKYLSITITGSANAKSNPDDLDIINAVCGYDGVNYADISLTDLDRNWLSSYGEYATRTIISNLCEEVLLAKAVEGDYSLVCEFLDIRKKIFNYRHDKLFISPKLIPYMDVMIELSRFIRAKRHDLAIPELIAPYLDTFYDCRFMAELDFHRLGNDLNLGTAVLSRNLDEASMTWTDSKVMDIASAHAHRLGGSDVTSLEALLQFPFYRPDEVYTYFKIDIAGDTVVASALTVAHNCTREHITDRKRQKTRIGDLKLREQASDRARLSMFYDMFLVGNLWQALTQRDFKVRKRDANDIYHPAIKKYLAQESSRIAGGIKYKDHRFPPEKEYRDKARLLYSIEKVGEMVRKLLERAGFEIGEDDSYQDFEEKLSKRKYRHSRRAIHMLLQTVQAVGLPLLLNDAIFHRDIQAGTFQHWGETGLHLTDLSPLRLREMRSELEKQKEEVYWERSYVDLASKAGWEEYPDWDLLTNQWRKSVSVQMPS